MARSGVSTLLGALALFAVFSGCQQPPRTGDDGVTAIQFQDIPVPRGLQLVERYHESDARQTGQWRYGNFVYTGKMPLGEVGDYMLARMPLHSWELEDDTRAEDGSRTLSFRRGKYVVECSLSKQSDATSRMLVKVRTTLKEE